MSKNAIRKMANDYADYTDMEHEHRLEEHITTSDGDFRGVATEVLQKRRIDLT